MLLKRSRLQAWEPEGKAALGRMRSWEAMTATGFQSANRLREVAQHRIESLTQARGAPDGFVARVVVVIALVVSATAALMSVAGWHLIEGFEQAEAAGRLQQGQAALAQRVRDLRNGLPASAALLASQPWVRGGVSEGDFAAAAQRFLERSEADYVAVLDPNGGLQVAPAGLTRAMRDALTPAAASASAGARFQPVDGAAGWVAAAPLAPGEAGQGWVFTGAFLGDRFAERFKARTGMDLTLTREGAVVGSTLTTPTAPVAHTGDGERADGGAGLLRVQRFPPHPDPEMAFGEYSLGVPASRLGSQSFDLTRELLFFVLKIVAIAMAAAFVFTRMVLRPLGVLTGTVARIGGGDLATPIAAALQDSAGPLGRELETMRRRLQQTVNELAVERSRYQGIFQSISDGVFTTDLAGNLSTVNPAAAAVLQPDPAASAPASTLPAAGAMAGTIKERLRRADGAFSDFEITAAPIRDEAGHQVGAVHVMRDISAQEHLRRLQQGFLLRVAHELRTPLSALSVSAEILKADIAEMPPQTRNGMLDTMHRGAVRLQHLVSNLLDLGNIEAGRFLVRTHPTALDTLVHEAVDLCEHLNRARRQQVLVALPQPSPKVEADGRRVVQVLVNLLTNAAKHAGEGPVTVAVRTLGTHVELAVTDPGPGMTAEEAARVFDHYHQANRPHAHDGQGFGLGLAIARGIVEAHGGQMGLANGPGRQTTFWFTLPCARCRPEVAGA